MCGFDFLSLHSIDQKIQKAKEKGQADNEDIDLMNNKSNHSVNLTIVPKGPCGSSVDNYLVREASTEEPIIDVMVEINYISGINDGYSKIVICLYKINN